MIFFFSLTFVLFIIEVQLALGMNFLFCKTCIVVDMKKVDREFSKDQNGYCTIRMIFGELFHHLKVYVVLF